MPNELNCLEGPEYNCKQEITIVSTLGFGFYGVSTKRRFTPQRSVLGRPYTLSNIFLNFDLFQIINFMEVLRIGLCFIDDFIVGSEFLYPESFPQVWKQNIVTLL